MTGGYARLALWACVLFVFADLGFSFLQHYAAPLDGDMPEALLPLPYLEPVLADPLGLGIVFGGAPHVNPNRFFTQWTLLHYFEAMPAALRLVADPLDAVYLSAAFAKTVTQAVLLGTLATWAVGGLRWRRLSFWALAALLTTLFQTNGYRSSMGLIDPATTYVFNYAMPVAGLLLYATPAVLAWRNGRALAGYVRPLWVWPLLTLPICLSGPLNPGIIGVGLLLYASKVLLVERRSIREMTPTEWVYFVPLGLMAVYSLWLGTANTFTITQSIPLAERYAVLPKGVFKTLTTHLGFPLLFAGLLLNFSLVKRRPPPQDWRNLKRAGLWLLAFSVLYLLLLPLGGYRPARPLIVRYDTMMPVTLGLMWLLGYSSYLVGRRMQTRRRRWYVPAMVVLGLAFADADHLEGDKNAGERALIGALQVAVKEEQETVVLGNEATVMSWVPVRNAEESKAIVALLRRWGVLKAEVRYVQREK